MTSECGIQHWLRSPSEIQGLVGKWTGSPLDPTASNHWYSQLAKMLENGEKVGWSPAFQVAKINWRRSQKWTPSQLVATANRVLEAKNLTTISDPRELQGRGDQFRGAIPPVIIQWVEGTVTPQDGNHRCGLAQLSGLGVVPALVHVMVL